MFHMLTWKTPVQEVEQVESITNRRERRQEKIENVGIYSCVEGLLLMYIHDKN